MESMCMTSNVEYRDQSVCYGDECHSYERHKLELLPLVADACRVFEIVRPQHEDSSRDLKRHGDQDQGDKRPVEFVLGVQQRSAELRSVRGQKGNIHHALRNRLHRYLGFRGALLVLHYK